MSIVRLPSLYSYDLLDRLLEAAVQTEATGTTTTQTVSSYAYHAIRNSPVPIDRFRE